MKNKKGAILSAEVLVVMIIAAIVVIIAMMLYFGVVRALPAGAGGGLDATCRINNGIIDKITLHPQLRPFCQSKSVDISADNWDKCDPNGNWSYKENKNYRDCAAEQIYHLISRCWYMYGEDELALRTYPVSTFTCFKFKVHSPEPIEISEWVITTQVMEPHGYCRSGTTPEGIVKMHNNDCEIAQDATGGCGGCGSKDSITGTISSSKTQDTHIYNKKINEGDRWEILYSYQDKDTVHLRQL
jgi:hypothetical protein